MKRRYILAAAVMLLLLTGCGSQRTGYENFTAPEQGASTLKPVSDIYTERHYEASRRQPRKRSKPSQPAAVHA